ncbi:hypothetical protein ScPMuIL_007171 [Solemya velum]
MRHKLIIAFKLILEFGAIFISGDLECEFQNGQCTYHIELSHPDDKCVRAPQNIKVADTEDSRQNDYSVMEENFHVVKNDHERRIQDLESAIQKVLSSISSGSSESRVLLNSVENAPTLIRSPAVGNSTEGSLLAKLHDEFKRLRLQLKAKTRDLISTQNKLNETNEIMLDTQGNLIDISEQLLLSENKVANFERERAVLKNQVKDKTERLIITENKLNVSEIKRTDLENQLYELVRSEANLKEELGFYQWKLNKTAKALELLQSNHSDLKARHSKLGHEMKRLEKDLKSCYKAKTQTFCGFEDENICGFTQGNSSDFFDWARIRGTTPSASTGPEGDHTCQGLTGHFMYIEASAKGRGNNAIMMSPKYWGTQQLCVEFHYHMYGKHVGTLNVFTKTSDGTELDTAWRAYGNQGNIWTLARLGIPKELARAGFQLVFEGITESGYLGDIALDDIRVFDGPCPLGHVTAIQVRVPRNLTSTGIQNLRRYKHIRQKLKHRKPP